MYRRGGLFVPGSFKYSYKTEPAETVSLAVYNVGFQKCEPSYGWGPGVRDHFLIHHVLSGQGTYRVGETSFSLKAGDTFLVYPNTEVYYEADRDNPWEYYWVGFAGGDAKLLLDRTSFTPEHPVISSDFGGSLKDALLEIYSSRGKSTASQVRMTGKLYLVLSLLISKAPSRPKNENGPLRYLRRAEQFIAYNYSRPINLEELADYLNVSRSSLYRVFMQYLGESPKEYLERLRIRRACELLRETDLSVGAVAISAGYGDSLYFSKAFRKRKGMTPTAFRESRKLDV